ncbi:MAG: CsiV family protein [Chromatiales bacterium]
MRISNNRRGRGRTGAALGALLALLSPAHTHAQSSTFQVEVVVFERNTPAPTVGGGARALPSAPTGVPVDSLPQSRLLLSGAVRELERSGQYTTLLHVGWQQGGEEGRPVRITSEALGADGRPIVDGDIRLAVGRQLTLSALLQCLYHGQVMVLREERNLRLGELHYFDHPLFGMLVQVTRVNSAPE